MSHLQITINRQVAITNRQKLKLGMFQNNTSGCAKIDDRQSGMYLFKSLDTIINIPFLHHFPAYINQVLNVKEYIKFACHNVQYFLSFIKNSHKLNTIDNFRHSNIVF